MDLTGTRFGRLTVESFFEMHHKNAYWYCVCDCGHLPLGAPQKNNIDWRIER